MALIFLGVLHSLGLLQLLPRGWGVPVLAVGLAVLSLSSSLRAWLRSGAYQAEAPGNPAARSAFRAGVMVTAAELALAGLVCWYVLAQSGPRPPAELLTARQLSAEPAVTAPEKSGEKKDLFWVDEAEALKLLKGKDAAYLNALVRRKDIRAKVEGGRTLYRRDDISAMITAGLPNRRSCRRNCRISDKMHFRFSIAPHGLFKSKIANRKSKIPSSFHRVYLHEVRATRLAGGDAAEHDDLIAGRDKLPLAQRGFGQFHQLLERVRLVGHQQRLDAPEADSERGRLGRRW